eukprot:1878449-Amphidinium_carterae.2
MALNGQDSATRTFFHQHTHIETLTSAFNNTMLADLLKLLEGFFMPPPHISESTNHANHRH